MVDYLHSPVTHEAFFKKYASKKFLKGKSLLLLTFSFNAQCHTASILSRQWAKKNYQMYLAHENERLSSQDANTRTYYEDTQR